MYMDTLTYISPPDESMLIMIIVSIAQRKLGRHLVNALRLNTPVSQDAHRLCCGMFGSDHWDSFWHC